MSKSELHDWECEIEELSGNNADKMLGIARDIYKTAFVRGRNSMTWEQTRWIPVSEKLPEVNQRVLVTSYGRVCYAMMISADANNGYPVFKLQGSLNERVVCETTVHNEFTTSRIKAWMPLPDPYRADNRTEQGLAYADQDTMMPAT